MQFGPYAVQAYTPAGLNTNWFKEKKFAAPLVLIIFLCVYFQLLQLYVFVRIANILCRCSAVHFVYIWCARWDICTALQRQYSTATVILISLSFHLAWQFMLINNGKYCRDNLCNKERLFCIHKWFIYSRAYYLVWQFLYTTRKMIFPRQIIFLAYYYFVYALLYL